MKQFKFIIMVGLISFGLILGCQKKGDNSTPKNDVKNGEKQGRKGSQSGPVTVETVTAKFEVLPTEISVVSVLLGKQQADVFSKVTGRISALGPKEGDRVKLNDILFRVDRNDPGESFLSTPVLSPMNGWVGRWVVSNIGEQVTTQSPIVTIIDDIALRAMIYLPTEDWILVKNDTSVEVSIGEEKRKGSVLTIARAGDPSSGRGSVLIEVPNEDRGWRVGMISRVTLSLAPRQRMTIPSSGLTLTEYGAHVFVIVGGKAKKTSITFDVITSDLVEIKSGLNDGDQVVVLGNNLLSEGAEVSITSDKDDEKKG